MEDQNGLESHGGFSCEFHGFNHEIVEGSLEVKLPTIWTDGKAEVGRVKEEKRKRKRTSREKRRGQVERREEDKWREETRKRQREEKERREEAERKKRRKEERRETERREDKRKSQRKSRTKEDAGARTGREVVKYCVCSIDLWLGTSKSRLAQVQRHLVR